MKHTRARVARCTPFVGGAAPLAPAPQQGIAPQPSSPPPPRGAGRAAALAAPKTVPLLHVSLSKTGDHIIRFADSARPMRKAKPKDVACLELFISITAPGSGTVAPHPDVPADKRPADELIRTAELTRNPTTIKHPPEIVNAIEELTRQHSRAPLAIYHARWSTGRDGKGARGPWSTPAAVTVVTST